MNLKKLVKEVLENKNCCTATKPTKAPILNENLAPRDILSEGLKYHIDNKKPLTEHVYRAGSQNYFNLWAEARALYTRGILDFSGDDLAILTETHLGEFGYITEIEIGDKVKASKEYGGLSGEVVDIKGSFIVVKTKEGNQSYHESDLKVLNKEGIKVPLDFPILEEENKYSSILEDITTFGKVYENINIENSYSLDNIESDDVSNSFIFTDKHGIKRKLSFFKGNSIKLLWLDPLTQKWSTEKTPSKYEDDKVMNTFGKILVKIILPKYGSFVFRALNTARYRLFRALIYNNLDTSKYDMDFNDETMEIEVYNKNINEAKNEGLEIGDIITINPKSFPNFEFPYGTKGEIIDINKVDYASDDLVYSVKIKYIDSQGDETNTLYIENSYQYLTEAKNDNKPIGKPMRDSSGGKAYKVYVKDPKTKKIKTVRFGSGGLKAKINNPKARKAFAKRHRCGTGEPKTSARYWSCRLPRFSKLLGLKGSFSGFW
jgi:hypothetical protein